jgi:hypothetical protein
VVVRFPRFGTLVVTADFAGVWADSRYWEQADKELAGSGIELMKLRPGQPGRLSGWASMFKARSPWTAR